MATENAKAYKVQKSKFSVGKANFIAVITDLEEDYFTSPDKETVLTTVLTEQETYEEKHTEFLRKHYSGILEAENALT